MNRVLLTGRLTRDPELRVTANGKSVTTFNVATHEYAGNGKERSEYHTIVTWDRLAQICGRYLGKGQQVAVEGRIQTRTWDDAGRPAALEDRDRRIVGGDALRRPPPPRLHRRPGRRLARGTGAGCRRAVRRVGADRG